MPFCSQCGTRVVETDAYCGRCGAQQPPPAQARPVSSDPLAALNPRLASILCYLPTMGWIVSIIVLAADKFRRDRVTRFHAFQGLYLFVAWLMASWVLRPLSFLVSPHMPVYQIAQAILLVMSVFMMIKAAHNEAYSLPL